jgi:hypothetical protein
MSANCCIAHGSRIYPSNKASFTGGRPVSHIEDSHTDDELEEPVLGSLPRIPETTWDRARASLSDPYAEVDESIVPDFDEAAGSEPDQELWASPDDFSSDHEIHEAAPGDSSWPTDAEDHDV